ncbi:hypothetical protein [Ruminococcus sp. Marseille-P6503]|uniref:hypothetical protein n=1 Tax=Ruminococcus sp. Marseille-P6503 TaxID=2364796 RepID=UPI000F51EC85|nr:hypothetical protein [Ruminococcus sp. Marseille-P6503]
MSETITKLKRSHLIHCIDSTFGGETPSWFTIGKDIEDMSMELNPSTSTVKNILDETSVNDEGYEPSLSVETYYANVGDSIYTKIKDIAMNRLTGDECKTTLLEILIDKTSGAYDAWTEDVIVKPQSYGGPQGGVNIPFTVTPCGNRIKGTVTIANKVPTFTADAEG